MRPRPSRFPILRPPPRRLVVAAILALLVATTVYRTTTAASARARALGETAAVAVALADLEPGHIIEPDDVAMVQRPVAHLPDTAVGEDPTGRALRTAIVTGEILTTDRVAGEGRTGVVALIPEGWRAVTIPVIDTVVPATPGDLVDVIASFDPTLAARDPSLVIAADAVVVDVAENAVTLAVTRERVTEVAFALANGIVTLALVG